MRWSAGAPAATSSTARIPTTNQSGRVASAHRPRILLRSNEVSDTGRNKTVVTAISKISDRPVAKEACLVVIYGLELGKKFNLNRPQIIIGRSSKADIQIDQEAVSRNHCKIINTGNAIMLRDMGSTNGTYVKDEMIDEYVLRW